MIYSKATLFKNSLAKIKEEPHFGLLDGVLRAFNPESALALGSSSTASVLLYRQVEKLMIVDFAQKRYDANLSKLPARSEFYPKCFPIYDDQQISGAEGLDISDLYARIKAFFKNSDLLVIDQPFHIATSSLNYFKEINDIVIVKGFDPSVLNASGFSKYRMIARYGGISSLLIKNHIPIDYDELKSSVYHANTEFYKKLGLIPSFRFEKA